MDVLTAVIAGGVAAAAIDGYPEYRGGGWFVARYPMLSIEGERLGLDLGLDPTLKNRIGRVRSSFRQGW